MLIKLHPALLHKEGIMSGAEYQSKFNIIGQNRIGSFPSGLLQNYRAVYQNGNIYYMSSFTQEQICPSKKGEAPIVLEAPKDGTFNSSVMQTALVASLFLGPIHGIGYYLKYFRAWVQGMLPR